MVILFYLFSKTFAIFCFPLKQKNIAVKMAIRVLLINNKIDSKIENYANQVGLTRFVYSLYSLGHKIIRLEQHYCQTTLL